MEEFAMTQLTDQERTAQMNDMRSFDEQMPCVGIFWYDPADRSFFGVRMENPIESGPLFPHIADPR